MLARECVAGQVGLAGFRDRQVATGASHELLPLGFRLDGDGEPPVVAVEGG